MQAPKFDKKNAISYFFREYDSVRDMLSEFADMILDTYRESQEFIDDASEWARDEGWKEIK